MARAVPFSTLVRHAIAFGRQVGERYPDAFLVWEPGVRVANPGAVPLTTVVPLVAPRTPVSGDPLCFPLVPPAGGGPLTVGRDEASDVVLDDRTVSRAHLLLWPLDGGWSATVPRSSHATTLIRNLSLQPNEKIRLVEGCAVVCGGVTCTFHLREGLLSRVLSRAESLKSQ